ncbi:MAG: RIP metalloprotease RseP [Proteobacteria bacterium]|nr:RIP metalloprotease RseP [Pseudomonadota bacterium]
MTIAYFIIALGALIFIHEVGHFITAKRAGVCVEVFSLGFGPRLFGFRRGETDYRVSLLPLGGYVKMLGEEPGEEGSLDPRSYAAKGVWTRARVVLMGPMMNIILCLIVMPAVFMLGRAEPAFLRERPLIEGVKADSPAQRAGLAEGDLVVSLDGRPVSTWDDVMSRILVSPGSTIDFGIERGGELVHANVAVEEMPDMKGGYVGIAPMLFVGGDPVVDDVRSGGPADEAGIRPGDRVLSYGGGPVDDWLDLTKRINESKGGKQRIAVDRGGETVESELSAEYSEEFGRWVIGISKDSASGVPMTVVRHGFVDSVVRGTKENIKLARMTFDVLWRLVTLKLSYKVLGGPIIIAKTSAAAAAAGFANFLYFIAFLSLQLGILNFLPIPVLDGGQLVFLGLEAAIRRPLNSTVRAVAHHVGFLMLIGLMLLVTINDIDNVWGIRRMIEKIF